MWSLAPPLAAFVQSIGYVEVKMRWKKDASFDAVPVLAHARDLRPLVSLARLLSPSPTPVSAVSKLRRSLETSDRRVGSFLRRFPAAFVESVGPEHNHPWFRLLAFVESVGPEHNHPWFRLSAFVESVGPEHNHPWFRLSAFVESVGPEHNHPWFRLSASAARLQREERDIFAARCADITSRLRRLLLMFPLSVAQGVLWHLGLPEDYFKRPDFDIGQDGFRILTTGDVVCSEDENHGRELGLIDDGKDQEMPLSVLQMGAIRRFGSADEVPFPLFQSKGLRLKRKIGDWMEGFRKLPYISPYEDFSNIYRGSDVSEKRAVGVLHELLSLFVTCSAERRRLLCLRRHLWLSQKFHKVFERHPHVFYLLLKEKTCFVVLKEAYMAAGNTSIEEHPMLEVRSKYARLMEESREIMRRRRSGKPVQLNPEDRESGDLKGVNSAAVLS